MLNNKPHKNTPHSRWYFFEQQERSLLKTLPSQSFTSKKVVTLTVQRNYHVQLTEDHRYYNVPDAIMDRMTANANRIELKGESLRRKKQQPISSTLYF